MRAAMLARARRYFAGQDVLAVDTAALSPSAPTDPHIASMSVQAADSYLHTSPEFHMKRLLADGYPDIYTICRVFRDGESGRHHLPEFTMIEWYRHAMSLDAIIADTLQLIAAVLERPELVNSVSNRDYSSRFADIVAINPLDASIDQLADVVNADEQLRLSLGDDRDAWLDLIMATKIAPRFSMNSLTVVKHYPVSQAALARFCPANAGVADRFEVYYGALELANGYVELSDAQELARRMDNDLAVRSRLGMPAVPRDEQLIAALESGLPECAGVAMGFERLHMVAAGADDIRNLVCFA
jgi:lysyl-tRNA synthetase class 2